MWKSFFWVTNSSCCLHTTYVLQVTQQLINTQHFILEMSTHSYCCVFIFVKQTVNSCSDNSSRICSIEAGSLSPQQTIPISFTDRIKTRYFWGPHQQKPYSTAISHWLHAVTMLPTTGRQHRGCIIPQTVTHSLVLLKMGKIISRNMLSWLELLISRYCCI